MQIQLLDYVTNEGSNAEGAEALDVRHRREVFPHVRSQLDRVENDNSFRFAVPLVREGNTCHWQSKLQFLGKSELPKSVK